MRNLDKKDKLPYLIKVESSLGPLESEVMEVVWSGDKVKVAEVTEVLRSKKSIAYTTVMTIMDNLFKKGFLTRKKIGKAYIYRPVARKKIFIRESLYSIINNLLFDYGRLKIFLAVLWLSLSYSSRSKLSTTVSVNIFRNKISIWHGSSFTLIAFFLLYSLWDLFQNLQFFGTIDYLRLAISEPTLVLNRFDLFASAVIESLPTLNVLATIILLSLFIFVGKKLSQFLDITFSPRIKVLSK